MGIEYLQLYQYRNLADGRISVNSPCILLRGDNGQGKTNFLEAVYFLCYASSFRSTKEKNIVKYGENSVSVIGKINNQNRDPFELSVFIDKGKKGIKKEGKVVKDRKEIIKESPCVVFSHGDINYAGGSQELKRRFIDQIVSLFDISYIDYLRKYKIILKNRNAVLKQNNESLLAIYDRQLSETGWLVQKCKNDIFNLFNKDFVEINKKIDSLPNDLEMIYKPSWKGIENSDDIMEKLRKDRKRDIVLGLTTSGPHRDQFIFRDGKNRDFSENASTGQLRLLSLILKMSQAEFINSKVHIKPILLIDDVLLELDKNNTQKVLENLPQHEQAFYTFLPDDKAQVHYSSTIQYNVVRGVLE